MLLADDKWMRCGRGGMGISKLHLENNHEVKRIDGLPIAALLTAASIAGAQDISTLTGSAVEKRLEPPPRPARPEKPPLQRPVMPKLESTAPANAGFAKSSVFAAAAPTSTATPLIPPLTVSYSGNNPTLLIQTTGPNKGLESLISNVGSPASAVYGQTNGSGAGVTGYNSGTVGPAAKFEITNPSSLEPVVYANTSGAGSAPRSLR